MKYFLDTEFIEYGKTIDLISIGIVSEDGREFYALNADCDWSKANQWVRENVLAGLPDKPAIATFSESDRQNGWMRHAEIGGEVLRFVGGEAFIMLRKSCLSYFDLIGEMMAGSAKVTRKMKDGVESPEFWADYADYDWVVFCQLFGTMMDLPQGFPMYCHDLRQECDRLGIRDLPRLEEGVEHNALHDAREVKYRYEWLQAHGRA